MTANRRSAQCPLGQVDTNGNRLNQARVVVLDVADGHTDGPTRHRLRWVGREKGFKPERAATPKTKRVRRRIRRTLVHSITSSARARIVCGIVKPSALAPRLTSSSKVAACCTGSSPGPRSLQDPVDVTSSLAEKVSKIGRIGDETRSLGKFP